LNKNPKSSLLGHLNHLALVIGERNLGNPGSLEATAQYIQEQFEKTGLDAGSQKTKGKFKFP